MKVRFILVMNLLVLERRREFWTSFCTLKQLIRCSASVLGYLSLFQICQLLLVLFDKLENFLTHFQSAHDFHESRYTDTEVSILTGGSIDRGSGGLDFGKRIVPN